MRLLTLIKGNKLVVPLACIATLAMMGLNELSYQTTKRYTQNTQVIMRTQDLLAGLQARLLSAETGQRGYLLTGRLEYLLPYEQALVPVAQSFDELRVHYGADSVSLAMLNELETLSKTKLSEMAQTIALKKGNFTQAALDRVLDNSGRENMQRMRLISDTLLTSEASNLEASQKDMRLALVLSRASIALLSVMSLIAILFYLRRTLQLKSEQADLKHLLATERDQLEVLVKKRTDELTQLALYLQHNREEERSRLARNLHDDLGALLTSAKLDTARIKSRVDQNSPQVLELLEHLVGNLNGSIALGRKIIEDLRPSALNNLGLLATLEIFADEFKESSGLQVHCDFSEVSLPADSQLMVYRLMQEACTNIMKYAKATNVWLRLQREDGVIISSVRDDGVGFDMAQKITSSYGLLGMRYRVEAAQGLLQIISSPGKGTLVRARL